MTSAEETAFGALLRRLRIRAGLSQEALAQRAGLSADTVAALEAGRRRQPRAFTVGLLADALGLGLDERAQFAAGATTAGTPVRIGRSWIGRRRCPRPWSGASATWRP